ncbi:MAG: response regulator transcription factor [Candidatus Sumerlaeia bacterium]
MVEPQTRTSPKKIMVVDDHPIIRQGLQRLIENKAPDLELCWEADSSMEALNQMGEGARPDIMLVDLSLKESSGFDLIKSVRNRFANMPILVVSMHEEMRYAERALHCGASGYIMKREMSSKVIDAIHEVLQGNMYVSEELKNLLLQQQFSRNADAGGSPTELLSDREFEVFSQIGQAKTIAEISKALHVSVKTVETHCARIKKKLHLRNSIELHQQAYRWTRQEQQ